MTRILVVDDEPQILRALGVNLRARGYEVDLAGRARPRSGSPPSTTPTSCVLDLGLPGIDGVEVIDGLRGWTQRADRRALGARRASGTRSPRSTPVRTTT